MILLCHNMGLVFLFLASSFYTCQPIQFTSIKLKKVIILGRYGHTGKWIQENIVFMRFCFCFKLSKKTEKMHTDWPSAIG